MNTNFQRALAFVFQNECVFSPGHVGDLAYVVCEDVPGDSGGLTKWGIDQADHPNVNIRDLDQAGATRIYHDEEWTKCRCDDLPGGYDIAVFDCAVNNGTGTAARLLQKTLDQILFNVAVDGAIGPATIAAAQSAGLRGLARFLTMRQKLYYDIVTSHPGDQKFLKGWLNRNNALAALVSVNLSAIA